MSEHDPICGAGWKESGPVKLEIPLPAADEKCLVAIVSFIKGIGTRKLDVRPGGGDLA